MAPGPGDAGAVDIWVADARSAELRAAAATADVAEADRYVRASDRDLFLGRRGLLRLALRAYVGAGTAAEPLDTRCRHCGAGHGKPRLPGSGGLDFSVSRSRHMAAVAVTAAGSIGLDIEHLDRAGDVLDAATTCLAAAEIDVLATLGERAAAGAALRFWTAKEAVTKAVGLGMAVDFRSITCRPDGMAFDALPGQLAAHRWQLVRPDLGTSLVACVATDRPARAVTVRSVPTYDVGDT